MPSTKKLILEDGSIYEGFGFGADRETVCEIVFNTSMTGYQEILSDPSYTGQAVVMSYPLIGNYGITNEDFESRIISPSALIVRDINDYPSNFRSAGTVEELLKDHGIPGIWGVDTRKLVKHIREMGTGKVLLTGEETSAEEAVKILREAQLPRDQVKRCSCRRKWYSRTSNPQYHVVAVDCGMKQNIVRMLNRVKCNVTIVPYSTDAE